MTEVQLYHFEAAARNLANRLLEELFIHGDLLVGSDMDKLFVTYANLAGEDFEQIEVGDVEVQVIRL